MSATYSPWSTAMAPWEKAAVLFLLKHLASGAAGGVVLGGGLLLFDVANLRTLVCESDQALVALLLLFSGLMVTFGGAAIALGVHGLAEDRRPGDSRDRYF